MKFACFFRNKFASAVNSSRDILGINISVGKKGEGGGGVEI
jgi:hypothetical protein